MKGKYFFGKDDSGHLYMIPQELREDWGYREEWDDEKFDEMFGKFMVNEQNISNWVVSDPEVQR